MAIESNTDSAIIRQEVDSRMIGADQAEARNFQDVLWDKCVGLSMSILRIGDKIFYFPQGHIEQDTTFTIDESLSNRGHAFSVFNIPPMILCEVASIHRKVGADIDDLYADITLVPQREKKALSLEVVGLVAGPQPQRTRVYSFCKKLTASDINIHGGLTIPKKSAEKCLPPLDMSLGTLSQDLVAQDLHGIVWHFTHVFHGTPKRHMFTAGWSTFVGAKRLEIGDYFIFIRRETGELGVGVRRAHRGEPTVVTPFMSQHSMQLGVLGPAFHGLSSDANITLYYRPRTIHSEFIIPYDRCMTSIRAPYRDGMRFIMRGEAEEEDKPEQRFAGRIVGIEDVDPIRWPGSMWRCLKVQWEDQATAAVCPNRLSPWNIEPIAMIPTEPRSKRAHASSSASTSNASFQSINRPHLGLIDHPLLGISRAIDSNVGRSRIPNAHLSSQSCEFHELRSHELSPVTTTMTLPIGSDSGNRRIFCVDLVKSAIVSSPSRKKSNEQLHAHHHRVPLQVVSSRIRQSLQPRQPRASGSFHATEDNNKDAAASGELPNDLKMENSLEENLPNEREKTEAFKENGKEADVMGDNEGNDGNRTFTKVQKYGCTLVRSVDLHRFDGFDGLIRELDHMFKFEGKLMEPGSKWCLIFKDNEGDLMMLCDHPWRQIYSEVQKILLCPKEELHKLNPSFL